MAFSLIFFVSLYKRRVLQNKLAIQEIQTQHQQDMLRATLTSQEEERNRLGTELHDGVGALLSSIKMNLQVSQKANSLDAVPEIIEYLTDTIGQVRSISHEMMPVILKKYGLKKAVNDLFEKISNNEVEAAITDWDDFELEKSDESMLYRIIQELTNNTLKHSGASQINLSCSVENAKAQLTFSDDGKGYPEEVLANGEGMGLWNILNRAQSIGATAQFSNMTKGGACTELIINLESE